MGFRSITIIREHVPLRTCNRDITSHLKRLKTSHANINGEWHLILLRAGLFEVQGESLTICPLHRDVLGTLWNSSRPPTKCSHPLHRTSKAKPDRGVSPAFSKAIRDHWGRFVRGQVGENAVLRCFIINFVETIQYLSHLLYSIQGLCGRCRKLHSEEIERKKLTKADEASFF